MLYYLSLSCGTATVFREGVRQDHVNSTKYRVSSLQYTIVSLGIFGSLVENQWFLSESVHSNVSTLLRITLSTRRDKKDQCTNNEGLFVPFSSCSFLLKNTSILYATYLLYTVECLCQFWCKLIITHSTVPWVHIVPFLVPFAKSLSDHYLLFHMHVCCLPMHALFLIS